MVTRLIAIGLTAFSPMLSKHTIRVPTDGWFVGTPFRVVFSSRWTTGWRENVNLLDHSDRQSTCFWYGRSLKVFVNTSSIDEALKRSILSQYKKLGRASFMKDFTTPSGHAYPVVAGLSGKQPHGAKPYKFPVFGTIYIIGQGKLAGFNFFTTSLATAQHVKELVEGFQFDK